MALEAPRVGKGGKGHRPPHLGEHCSCLGKALLLSFKEHGSLSPSRKTAYEPQPASENVADGSKEPPKGPHPRLVAATCQGIQSDRSSLTFELDVHACFVAVANTCFTGNWQLTSTVQQPPQPRPWEPKA